ncbi:hypothetical protein BDFG_03988 [Blastomyces dermatitidis ATCC 26199]|nr:hypothetical protein BDFG_03988 [Blastomyces dermatitidis ATCC 26199]
MSLGCFAPPALNIATNLPYVKSPGTLPRTTAVAEPEAANAVRKFRHFHHTKIVSIPEYNSKRPQSVLRFPDRAVNGIGCGRRSHSRIAADTGDLAGVHNAIGITYQTPHSGTVLWSRLNTSIPSHGHSQANRPSPSPNSSPRNSIPTLSRAGGSHIYCGNIIAGASRAGVPLAKKLRAECWIGAHDEENISGGVIMKFSQE